MATKKRFEKEVTKHGAQYDDEGTFLIVWAPEGYVWMETGTCSMSAQYADYDGSRHSWKPECYLHLIEGMSGGLDTSEEE